MGADAGDSSPFAPLLFTTLRHVKYLRTFIPLTVNKNKLLSVGLQMCRSYPSHFTSTKWARFLS